MNTKKPKNRTVKPFIFRNKFTLALFVISIISLIGMVILVLVIPKQNHIQQTASPYISRLGKQLLLHGQPIRLTGYNSAWFGTGCSGNSVRETDAEFSDIHNNAHGNVVREAWFQGGDNNLAFTKFDQQISEAKKYGIHIIPILVNEWKDCEPSKTIKNLSWYQTGYKQTNDGYPLSYRDYVMKIAAHYAKEPTIAWWQLVNEPDGRNLDGSCDEKAATDALRWFADDVTGAIKSVDPNHMVDLGSISWCGQQGTDFQYVNAGAVDLCDSYHDYSNATNAFVSKDHLAACNNLNKPSYVGEAGICADVDSNGNCTGTITQTTLDQRDTFFDAKMNAALIQNNLQGYIIWAKAAQSISWGVGLGDPTNKTVAKYALAPSTPTPTPVPGSMTVDDSVSGTSQNQWNYQGTGWTHCTSCNETNPVVTYYNASQSWDSTTNDSAIVTFTGTQLVLYGVTGPWHGIGAVSIDGGTETNVDFYSSIKTGNVLLWTSPVLPSGTHTFKIRVTGTKNASSTGIVIPVDRVDIATITPTNTHAPINNPAPTFTLTPTPIH